MRIFNKRIDDILNRGTDPCAVIEEGMILNVNKLISDTIRIPEGDYIVASVTPSQCVLVPTSEANKDRFEVFKPTLAGFFNPEVHKKVVDKSGEGAIIDSTALERRKCVTNGWNMRSRS